MEIILDRRHEAVELPDELLLFPPGVSAETHLTDLYDERQDRLTAAWALVINGKDVTDSWTAFVAIADTPEELRAFVASEYRSRYPAIASALDAFVAGRTRHFQIQVPFIPEGAPSERDHYVRILVDRKKDTVPGRTLYLPSSIVVLAPGQRDAYFSESRHGHPDTDEWVLIASMYFDDRACEPEPVFVAASDAREPLACLVREKYLPSADRVARDIRAIAESTGNDAGFCSIVPISEWVSD